MSEITTNNESGAKVSIERTKTTSQWAQLCAKSLLDHLAPKGFSVIKAGVFKGKRKANIEFLEDKQVQIAGNIANGCLSHYRKRVVERLKEQLGREHDELKSWESIQSQLKWFKFKRKREIEKNIYAKKRGIDMLEDTIF